MRIHPSLLRPALALAAGLLLIVAAGCASTSTDVDAQPQGGRTLVDVGPEQPADGAAAEPAAQVSPAPAARPAQAPAAAAGPPTAAEAAAFVERAEADLLDLIIRAERAAWVQANFITHDTEVLAAEAGERLLGAAVRYAQAAARFDDLELPADVRRKLDLLKLGLVLPAPNDPEKTAALTRITTRLESLYGTGKYCPEGESELAGYLAEGEECLGLLDLERILAESRDPDELREAWVGWRTISPPMRDDYTRMVALANEGARELGYSDVGAMWRSKYDMEPDAFATELERLWGQVQPLYEALHCHVRAELTEAYGADVVPPGEPIPAHL
ncbi:MAG TPA: M2 family metallopeptidase, partial [Thermoanaerobaculia bacterium]